MKKQNNRQKNITLLTKDLAAFWPLFIIFVAGVMIGGIIAIVANNNRLEDDIDSMVIRAHRGQADVQPVGQTQTQKTAPLAN